jgi:hypothetical protein
MVRETVAMETFALWATVLISMSAGFFAEPRFVLGILFAMAQVRNCFQHTPSVKNSKWTLDSQGREILLSSF